MSGKRDLYRRLGWALHRRRGVRLSAADVQELVLGDNAVDQVVADACGVCVSLDLLDEPPSRKGTEPE